MLTSPLSLNLYISSSPARQRQTGSWKPQWQRVAPHGIQKNLEARGISSKNLINVYKRWGEGGLGLILTDNIMIAYDQLEAPGNPIIPGDAPFSGERFEAFKEMGAQSKKHGSLVVGQVSHPGRQTEARLQPNPVSASDVQLEGEVLGMKFANRMLPR
jgi:2,4-dienoyl-CoA reductase-like NADH-dependent reductase (Old Yellow Enzyme family)